MAIPSAPLMAPDPSFPLEAASRRFETQGLCNFETQGLCNHCGRLTEARIRVEAERVTLNKWCPDHGFSQGLISSDPQWYLNSLGYVKPPTQPLSRAVQTFSGCPDSCGLCPHHQQHTCAPILEITPRCDLNCPICLVRGMPMPELPPSRVRAIIDSLIEREGSVNMLAISGGEPTLHPRFLDVLDACLRPEVGIVSVSTNGLTLLDNEDLIKAIRDRGAIISLQYDGARPEPYAALRGAPRLAGMKARLIDRLLALGVRFSLTMTLARGVNEDELEGALKLLFRHDEVLSLMIQPLARMDLPEDPMDTLTIPDVVRLLAAQSGGILKKEDFTPLPCSHPSCFALTYLLKIGDGSLLSIPSLIPVDDYLNLIKNQALMGTDIDSLQRVREALYSLWSSDAMIPRRETALEAIKTMLAEVSRISASPFNKRLLQIATSHTKSIFIHHFMDRAAFDLSRAVKCCNHYCRSDLKLIPACVRNNIRAYGHPRTGIAPQRAGIAPRPGGKSI